jgi:hypothetical protein
MKSTKAKAFPETDSNQEDFKMALKKEDSKMRLDEERPRKNSGN